MGVLGGVIATKNTNSKPAEKVEAAIVSKDRIVLELEDQCWSTDSNRNATLHIWNISVDASMDYDTTDLKSEFEAASAINDFETGHTGKSLNDDGSIDTGFTWNHNDGNRRVYHSSFDGVACCRLEGYGCYTGIVLCAAKLSEDHLGRQ